nr:antitoxin VbhA family protein [uncultured Haemophilus sp.]
MFTTLEKIQRQEAVQFAINNNAMEGLFVSEQAKALFNRWIEGEITLEKVEQEIYALWRL